jgi:hypothetical protein
MSTRRFKVYFEIEGDDYTYGILELDQKVIDVVDDEWRSQLYDLHTPEEIASHIGYNLMRHGWGYGLTNLDGWADLDNSLAKVIKYPDLDQWETRAEEIK